MRHIKFIIRVSLFTFLLVHFANFISFLVRPDSINIDNITGYYGEKKNSIEMVYVGGSAAFAYFESLKAFEDTGLISYVYGSNTIQAEFYKYEIKQVLKTQKPEVIIIDARAFQYRDKDQVPNGIGYTNLLQAEPLSKDRAIAIENNVRKYLKEDPMDYHFDLHIFHARELKYDVNRAIKLASARYINPLKGFQFMSRVKPIEKYYFKTDKKTKPAEETDEILDDLLDYLKTTNTKVLFVVSPYREQEHHKEIFNYVEEKVKIAGFDFLDANDYREDMQLDYNTDFYDYNHVNIFGADKYTEFMEKYLFEHYNLTDNRNNPEYKKWHEYLEDFNKQAEITKSEIKKLIGESYGK